MQARIPSWFAIQLLDLLLFVPQEAWSLNHSSQLNLFMFDGVVPIHLLLCFSMTVPGLFIHVHIKTDLDKSIFIHAWMHVIPCLLLLWEGISVELHVAIVSVSVAIKSITW